MADTPQKVNAAQLAQRKMMKPKRRIPAGTSQNFSAPNPSSGMGASMFAPQSGFDAPTSFSQSNPSASFNGSFSSSQPMSAPSSSSFTFTQPQASSGSQPAFGGGFGFQSSSQPEAQTFNSFGSAPAAAPVFGGFGQANTTNSTSTMPTMFGAPQQSAAQPSIFNFGSTQQASQSGGFNFSATSQAPSNPFSSTSQSTTSASSFPSSQPSTTNMFASPAKQPSSIFNNSNTTAQTPASTSIFDFSKNQDRQSEPPPNSPFASSTPQQAPPSTNIFASLSAQQPLSPNPFASLATTNRASEPPQSLPAFPSTSNKESSQSFHSISEERSVSPSVVIPNQQQTNGTPATPAPKFSWPGPEQANKSISDKPATPIFSFGTPAQVDEAKKTPAAPVFNFGNPSQPSPVKDTATPFAFSAQPSSIEPSPAPATNIFGPSSQSQTKPSSQSNIFGSLNATPKAPASPVFSFPSQPSQVPQVSQPSSPFTFPSQTPVKDTSQNTSLSPSKDASAQPSSLFSFNSPAKAQAAEPSKPMFASQAQTPTTEERQPSNPSPSMFSAAAQPLSLTSSSRQNTVNGSVENSPTKQSEPSTTSNIFAQSSLSMTPTATANRFEPSSPNISSILSAPSTNNIFSQSSLAQAPPPSPKLANKTLVTADTVLPSIEKHSTEIDNINDIDFLDDAVLDAQLIRQHPTYSKQQRAALLEAVQLRAFNANFAAYLASIPPVVDCSSAMKYYLRKIEERNALHSKTNGASALPVTSAARSTNSAVSVFGGDTPSKSAVISNGIAQKANVVEQKKADKPSTINVFGQSATSSFQPPVLTNANVNGKRNATDDGEEEAENRSKQVKLNTATPPGPSATLSPLPPSTPVASESSAQTPSKSKRKAEFQLTKDDPTGDEADGLRSRKIAKPSSETSNRFKSIMDKSDRPVANADRSPSQAATPAKVNPFASLIPSTAPAASKTPAFAFTPTPSTTSKASTTNIFAKTDEAKAAPPSGMPSAPVTDFGFKSVTSSAPTPATATTGGFKPTVSGSSESAIKPPSFGSVSGGSSSSFLSQFQNNAKKSAEEAERKALQRAKDEDLDSDDDEAEFEANWRAKRAEEKKALEKAASKSASFVPGKGFVMSDTSASSVNSSVSKTTPDSQEATAVESTAVPKTANVVTPQATLKDSIFSTATPNTKSALFSSSTTNNNSSFFPPSNAAQSASSAAGSNTSSIFATQEIKKPVSFDMTNKPPNGDKDDDSTDEDNDDEEETQLAVSNTKNGTAATSTPNKTLTSSIFASATTTPPVFNFTKSTATKTPFSPATNATTNGNNPFANVGKTPTASTSPQDKTWSPNTPIKFAPSPASQVTPSLNITSATPEKSTSPFAGFGTTPAQKSSLFAGLNTPKPATSTNASENLSTTSSLFPSATTSVDTSRATSPGPATSANTAKDTGAEASTPSANDPDAEHHEQINLASTTAGEEEEDIQFEARGKATIFDSESKSWKVKGLGPLKVLKHRGTGASRTLLRSDPGGAIVLNKSILKGITYQSSGKTVKITTADDSGSGMETWLLQVKTNESAAALAKALEDSK